jgi:uncharacterized membrane protein YeaQ/YmgE (transglycosylase-associated protein family)
MLGGPALSLTDMVLGAQRRRPRQDFSELTARKIGNECVKDLSQFNRLGASMAGLCIGEKLSLSANFEGHFLFPADGNAPDGPLPRSKSFEMEVTMTVDAVLVWLLVGAIAGFLAGVIWQGYGLGMVGIGILGAFIGNAVLPRLGLFPGSDFVAQVFASTVGAVILLFLIGLVRRTA